MSASRGRGAAAVVFAAAAMIGLPAAAAPDFAVGNASSNAAFSDVPGQSFSPSIAGNGGSGMAPAAGGILLLSFEIGFASPVDFGTLYVFDRAYAGTPNALGGLAAGGPEGLLGASSAVADGVWDFGPGLQLPDVNAAYFAYLDSAPADYLSAESDGSAYDGVVLTALFADNSDSPFRSDNSTDEDIVFTARFASIDAPAPLALFGLGLVGLALAWRRAPSARPLHPDEVG